MNLADRIRRDGITAQSRPWDRLRDGAVSWGDSHWVVTLQFAGRSLVTEFHAGALAASAMPQGPSPEDVLQCLLSDAAAYLNEPTIEQWARELGYDEEDDGGRARYRSVEAQTSHLREFLGDAFDEYVWGRD